MILFTQLTVARLEHFIDKKALAHAIRELSSLFEGRERAGGFLALAVCQLDRLEISSMTGMTIGEQNINMHQKGAFAFEKIARLRQARLLQADHPVMLKKIIASSMGSNPQNGKYGGCVVSVHHGTEVYISYSGCSELFNEAIAASLQQILGFTVSESYKNRHLLPTHQYFSHKQVARRCM